MPIRFENFFIEILTAVVILLFTQIVTAQKQDHVPGDVIVMLKKNADPSEVMRQFTSFEGQSTHMLVQRELSRRMNIWLLHYDNSAIDENKLLSAIRSNDLVTLSQFNHYIQSRIVPDDEFFGEQWNMLNIGQTGGTSGSDIRATSAWDLTTGGLTASGDTIVIAIDDDGFDLNHEDLNYWKNYHEIPNNNIDDDSNGYIDDYDGWNAIDNNGTIITSYHGTHVSGIAGAIGNNSKGVAGVNWHVKIMPVVGNSSTEAVAVAGYAYILDMRILYDESGGQQGAYVVAANSSWGVDFGQPSNFPIWCAEYDSMGHHGILNTAATSNSSNVDVDAQGDMPTACGSDYLITVTSTNNNDQRQGAYGLTTIDLGAPGSSVWSTLPGNTYGPKSGTSMASPHVAGAVGLICSLPCPELSADLKNDPSGTALRIKNFILQGVDQVTDLIGKTVSGGRLNVYQALLNTAAYYNCNVGIDEVLADNSIIVYPNPASEEISVLIKDHHLKIENISLINLLGQLSMTESTIDQHSDLYQLDISSVEKGMYLLKLDAGKGIFLTKKILVN